MLCGPADGAPLPSHRVNTSLFSFRGKRAVIVGRSNIVGMPAAMLLNKRDATVTICHSATKDMEGIVRQADIVIAAAGQAQLIKGSWLKPGAALIDVGTNPVRARGVGGRGCQRRRGQPGVCDGVCGRPTR